MYKLEQEEETVSIVQESRMPRGRAASQSSIVLMTTLLVLLTHPSAMLIRLYFV
jgi:hypothetical protein